MSAAACTRTGAVRRATLALPVTLLLAATGPTALGQFSGGTSRFPDDGGPAIITPTIELETFQFETIDLALELEWRRNVEELDPAVGSTQRDTRDRFREILDVSTTGFVGHPNLAEFDVGGRFRLEQQWFEVAGADRERTDQTLVEWNADVLFFQETDLPFTVYTRQTISDLDRQFGGAIENTFRETGVQLNIRDDVLPTSVQAFRRRIDQSDGTNDSSFRIDQDTVQADGRIELGRTHRFAWDAKYDDVNEEGDLRTARSFTRFEANVTQTVEFGEKDQHVLRTRARIYDEQGTRMLRQVRIDPRLRLRHSEDFATWYDYSYGREDRSDQEQRTQRATANFEHQLYDSLTTIGTAGVNLLDIPTDDFTSDEAFGRLDVQYRKALPLGSAAMGLNGTFSRIDQSERGTSIAITDDLRIFNAGDLIVIDLRNIDPLSIVVTDVTGIIVYGEGPDYVVIDLPDRVEIRRVPGGFIAPGQAVLIDYDIGPDPGGRTDTTGLGADARYTFDEGVLSGLSMYVQYFDQDEQRSIQDVDFPENDFTDVRYGLEYNAWKLSLLAEQQHRSSTLAPFDAVRLEGRYTEPLGRGSTLVLSALFQEVERNDDGGRSRTTTLTGQWRQRFDPSLRMELRLQYQQTEDTLSFDSDSFEQEFDVVWERGKTEVYAEVRNVFNNGQGDDTTFQRFVVGVRREF